MLIYATNCNCHYLKSSLWFHNASILRLIFSTKCRGTFSNRLCPASRQEQTQSIRAWEKLKLSVQTHSSHVTSQISREQCSQAWNGGLATESWIHSICRRKPLVYFQPPIKREDSLSHYYLAHESIILWEPALLGYSGQGTSVLVSSVKSLLPLWWGSQVLHSCLFLCEESFYPALSSVQ